MFKRQTSGLRGIATATLVASAWLSAGSDPAFAAAGSLTYTFEPGVTKPVVELQSRVTYSEESSPPLNTYIGYKVTGFSNTGANTINNVSVTFTAEVIDKQEKLTLYRPEFYLPASCSWPKDSSGNPLPSNPVVITCLLGQMKAGSQPFPNFNVFYKTPVKFVGGDGAGDADDTDLVSTTYQIVYAEGTNDQPNSVPPNSVITASGNPVTLGTTNPVDVRTGLPKSDNAQTIFTGAKGVPLPNTQALLRAFTELVTVPSIATSTASYLTSTINITSATDGLQFSNCVSAGNFVRCPDYETTLLDPSGSEFVFDNAVLFVYRVDASNLKRSANQILNSVQLLYTGGIWVDEPVQACTNGMPNSNGLPCVVDKFCYKNNHSVVDLRGDCEWQVLNTRNGLTRAR
jgi:hypothetical protein